MADVPPSYPIPKQLRIPEARFIKVAARDKIPVEKDWQNEKNYAWDDIELVNWISEGGNYGVLPRGGICVIDLDDVAASLNLGILDAFNTFTVKSGSQKGLHLYIKCEGIPEKIPFYDKDDATIHIGEFYGSGCRAFAVGVGSWHPSGNQYVITRDLPLKEISSEDVDTLLFRKVKSNRFRELKRSIPENIKFPRNSLTDQLNLRIADFVTPDKAIQRGDEWQGSHPIHGSTTGTNFAVNASKNVWYCYRCGVGGDPVAWIAQTLGAHCSDLKDGVPVEYFKQVVDYLWANGYSDKLSALGHKRKMKTDKEPPSVKSVSQPIQETSQQSQELTPSAIHGVEPINVGTVLEPAQPAQEKQIEDYVVQSNPKIELKLEPDNFISQYIHWASNRTDAYQEYHFGMAISMLSISAQRAAVLMMENDFIYSNIWCFFLGLSSVSRRTTSIKLAKRILDQNEIIPSEMPKSFTPESLVEILDETPRAYLIKDEAAQLLVALKRQYMSDLRYVLCDLYDGEDYSRRLRSGKSKGKTSFIIKHPYITMVMATTPDTFEKSSDIENLTSGWFYRYLWFYPNHPKDVRVMKMYNPDAIQEEVNLRKRLLDMWILFSAHQEDPIKFHLTPEAMHYYNEWCVKNNDILAKMSDDPKLSMFARLQIHTLKLAMLFTIGRFGSLEELDTGNITITNEHVYEAIRVIETYFMPIAWKIYEMVELAESENDQKKILSALKQRGGKISRRMLMRKVRMKSKDLDDAIHQLVNETKELMEVEVKGQRGGSTIYYIMTKPEES